MKQLFIVTHFYLFALRY